MTPNALTFDPCTAAVALSCPTYPSAPPFHPSAAYPEYCWTLQGESNLAYEGVRQLFHLLKLDSVRYGTPAWNPLSAIVRPGDRVFVKPNYLWHSHKYRDGEWEQVITHSSVVRAVVDYVLLALRGRGEIWIADGPQLDADWSKLTSRTGIRSVCEFYKTVSPVPVSLLDLRDEWLDVRGDVIYGRMPLPGDPQGSNIMNLAHRSRFADHLSGRRYYGADYDQSETNYHHSNGRHEYRVSRTAALADVFINLPKMKTHKKVGVTLCLKNLVGINTGRNWLPHYMDGGPSAGGDQFPDSSIRARSERWGIRLLQRLALRSPGLYAPLFRFAKSVATPIWGHTKEVIRSGNWYGNDTTWRMVHDINRCLLYTDGDTFPTAYPKRYLAVVDGIVAGDGNGPETPDRREAGILVGGFNPVAVDCVAAKIMGFDAMKLAMLREAFGPSELPLAPFTYSDITVRSNRIDWHGSLADATSDACYHFRPHFGWRGRIELDDQTAVADIASGHPQPHAQCEAGQEEYSAYSSLEDIDCIARHQGK